MTYVKGLEGIVAAETKVGHVDGDKGQLIYRGYWAKDLAINYTFEEVAYLIWNGQLPNHEQLNEFKEEMKAHRVLPKNIVALMDCLPRDTEVMSALRTCISALGDPSYSWPPTKNQAVALTAIAPTIIAYWYRKMNGLEVVEPNENLDHVANYLYMITGEVPDSSLVKALSAYFVLTIEHGMNASTFSSRVVASTESDMVSAICGAIGAMKGPLHGGAPSGVISMFQEIGSAENIEPWVRQKLGNKEKIMGFGHRVYRTHDPRAEALKEVSKQISDDNEWFDFIVKIEDTTIRLLNEYKPGRKIYTNVEYFAAAVMKAVELPADLFTPTFTASRLVGWTAHVLEQSEDNRIYRPQSSYIGYTPVEQKQ
ncbi:citrate synthase/methylcitrate synthase [Priestia flexa]|jgi:citrate synthase|uniref:Citrate synthase n=1 Tax=Priestia flexa TaxID=86664 RepID=A0A8I1MF31_9BACI|nr:citrate synthase/methylcitrate synthase [Priestia flexa]MBN8252000.1 citrate synthase/methylcitrate synthase [Priestia flexa]MCA1203072.1 citrate synthase/methylcitrate synthase [Priestia flexa]MEC0667835.1 citrate synthase/methylcitrate synthase [Priestia flexa]MED3825575.1 citrate synthase/methylcitrate synthase [Priestia flexa]